VVLPDPTAPLRSRHLRQEPLVSVRIVPVIAAVALLVGLVPLGATEAAAQSTCPTSGGAGMPAHRDVPAGEVQVLGRGWGHGVGMSQYGARGAARLGCSVSQILTTYYPGTALAARDARQLAASLWPSSPNGEAAPHLDVRVPRAGDVPSTLPTVSALTWQVSTGSDAPTPIAERQPAGATWRAVVAGDRLELRDGDRVVWSGPTSSTLRAPLANQRTIQLPQKPTASWSPQGRPYARGALWIQPQGSATGRVNVRVVDLDSEEYLFGLAEMPSSWEPAALQAQAVAGRSYALRKTSGLLWDSASDQVYAGALKEHEPSFGTRWVAAVNATRLQVLTFEGGIAETLYSSSHGGQSESNRFSAFFSPNVNLPYLRPVDDTRWEAAAESPVATWSHAYTRDEVGRLFGVGSVRSITIKDVRGAGGRVGVPGRAVYSDPSRTYGGIEVVGTTGSRTVSGLQFVQTLNVTRRSELFTVHVTAPSPTPTPTPTEGDDGVTTRSDGPTRIETAAAVSSDHWDRADDVIVATAGGAEDGYADALSAAAYAARLDAPILLTAGDRLSPAVREELARLRARRVWIMGGPAAVSRAVEDALVTAGYDVDRVSGPTRFDTASAAARAAGASPSGDVALALGTNWPDAVSAGTLAGSADRVPTLLTGTDAVPQVTMDALRALGARRVLVIGGPAAVDDAVVRQLRQAGLTVERRFGASRFDTALAVARDAIGRSSGTRPVIVASGATFPDALAAGALSARIGGPIVLSPAERLPDATRSFIADGPFDRGALVGGRAALSTQVREQVAGAIRG
jgi:peptidoglycan hydrolase-like amidase/putative cell wall-binding protein